MQVGCIYFQLSLDRRSDQRGLVVRCFRTTLRLPIRPPHILRSFFCLQLDSDLLVAASVLDRLIWDRWLSTNRCRTLGTIPTINTTLWLAVVLVGMKLLAHLQEAQ